MTDELGHPILPDYDFDREVGRGGMGTVYLYRNAISQRPEVVKLLSREVLGKPGNRERFEREIRAAFRLQHPNIVAAYSTHRLGDALAFCMEYVEGDDLMRVVQQEGPLPAGTAAGFAVQALAGLQHAHERGMVHRDIKPGNLMRTREAGRAVVKVLDFGLAKFGGEQGATAESHLTHYGQVLGTPDFIAPEQIRNTAGADIRADIYSLGCTLFYLLAGRPPFTGESLFDLFEQHIHREPPDLDRLRPGLPPGLAAAVARLLAKDPADRPQTPAEAADLLLPYVQSGTNSYPSLQLLTPTTSAGSATTPPLAQKRPGDPTPAKPVPAAQFISLSHTTTPPAGSGRHRVRPPPPEPKGGWLLPVGVGAFLLAALGALAFVLFNGPPATPPTPSTPPTPEIKSNDDQKSKVEPKPKDDPPPKVEPKPKDDPPPKKEPPKSDGFIELVGPSAAASSPYWQVGVGELKAGPLTLDGGASGAAVLFEKPPAGDFDLTADLVLTGGGGLVVRGERRLAVGQAGYLIGLGQDNAPEYVAGAIHRWGHPAGVRKLLATGDPTWAKPGEAIRVKVEGRGVTLTVTVNGKPPVRVTDAQGYTDGRFGLAVSPGSRLEVRRLAVLPKPPAEATEPAPSDPDFHPLLTADRLDGWQVQGEDLSWEAFRQTLVGTAKPNPQGVVGNLLTESSHADFVLRFEYWLEPGSVAMVSVRVDPTDGRVTHPRLVLTDPALPPPPKDPKGKSPPKDPPTGSLVGMDAGTKYPANPAPFLTGTWHTVELTVDRQSCRVEIDGQVVNELTLGSKPAAKFIPGLKRQSGRIGVTAYAGTIRVRNLRVKDLKQ